MTEIIFNLYKIGRIKVLDAQASFKIFLTLLLHWIINMLQKRAFVLSFKILTEKVN